ncbi:histidine kinase [Neisseriaceae bacterium TC5R-5]|nr:histidine kinase [Neisseriaceae bacterium TC5R-5]
MQRLPTARLLVVVITMLSFLLFDQLISPSSPISWHAIGLAGLSACLLLHYFSLRERALSPALAEARLAALQARIHPHFLFNSLNAAIALIRLQPVKAEMVLENLAELFRAQLADPGGNSSLLREIELANMYLAIESERLGERLNVHWQIDAPLDAILPSLFLQPLVENAVFHGVERLSEPSIITIMAKLKRQQLELTLSNSVNQEKPPLVTGHQMALANLAERLELFFDAEASLETIEKAGFYTILIRLPYRRSLHSRN